MKNKIFIVCALFLILGGAFGFAQNASAQTVGELQAQIQALLAQVQQLQAQLVQLQGGSVQWCHTFNTNLRVGDGGDGGGTGGIHAEVKALIKALSKEGVLDYNQVVQPGSAGTSIRETDFSEEVAAAVVGFQQKYRSEILTPNGLQFGTGFVGISTRAKLNALYGCNGIRPIPMPVPIPWPVPPVPTQPSITVLSPNGGQQPGGAEVWEVGKTYDVTWNYSGPKECAVSIILTNAKTGMSYGGNNLPISAYSGRYSFTVSDNISPGSDVYKIEVNGSKGCPSDESDNYFSIVASTPTTQPSITILSPNGGETWEVGKTYTVQWKGFAVQKGRWAYASLFSADGKEIHGIAVLSAGTSNGVPDAQVVVPTYLKPGLYRLQVSVIETSTNTRAYDDTDGYINVVSQTTITPSITVLSPNGGESWQIGKSYTISWRSTGAADPSRFFGKTSAIHLVRGNGDVLGIATAGLIDGSQSFTWAVPLDVKAGNDYKIRVSTVGDNGRDADFRVFDLSDNYFSIISVPQTTPLIGDVNQNGTVGIEDSLFIAQYVVGSRTLTLDQWKMADVNSDGKVSTNDANIIAVYLVGLLTVLPVDLKVGDVDKDGTVSIADSLFIVQYEAGSRTLTQIQLAMADVNNDAKVTKADADTIAQYLVGLVSSLPYPAAPLAGSVEQL